MTESPAGVSSVVGIGASAQGLNALRKFFSAVADDSGLAYVVIQHLAPGHTSNLAELLAKSASIPVESASEGVELEPGHVYVISPGELLSYRDGRLHTTEIPELDAERHTIDVFLKSIAEQLDDRSVGILLSGAGSDGTAGLQEIKRHGGLTMAQDPEEAGVDMMPRHAIDAGVVDVVAPAVDLASRLREIVRTDRHFGPDASPAEIGDEKSEALDVIMALLRDGTGNDLSEYKRSTVLRRIGRRMQVNQIDSLEDYCAYLDSNSDEIDALFDELTIKVTSFFRDPEAWERLGGVVIPSLFEGKDRDDEVRVWVPGCATGEEAYTVAMLLLEYADQLESPPEIKVFATDIDHGAIATAREGVYPAAVAADVPPEYLRRHFRIEDSEYRVAKNVRNLVLFAPQNALTDPPFANLDLITCRNLLIYLQPSAQTRLLQLLHYGLRDGGFLMLGSAERPSTTPELFREFDEEQHIYRARQSAGLPVSVPGTAFGFDLTVPSLREEKQRPEPEVPVDIDAVHRDAVLDAYGLASVLVDEEHTLLHAMGETDPYTSVPTGTPTDDFVEMVASRYRPVVRTLVFEAFHDGEESLIRHVAGDEETGQPAVEIRVDRVDAEVFGKPVIEISFRTRRSGPEGEERPGFSGEGEEEETVESYERELAQTRKRLQNTIREYEAANEKLRASNEELMSMNEELQSTSEELETSKEEFQSMNEELQTVNSELNEKIRELDSVNSDLRNLMRSTQIGTLFLDRALEIKRFTDPVTDIFNIQNSDLDRPLEHVTHRLRTDELADIAREVIDELVPVEREVESTDGRTFLMRVLPYLTVDDRVDGVVLAFIDVTERRRIQDQLASSEKKFRTVFESAADPMVIYRLDSEGHPGSFMEINSVAVEKVGRPRNKWDQYSIGDLLGGGEFDLEAHLERIRTEGESTAEAELSVAGGDESIPVEVKAKRVDIGEETAVVEVMRDITDQKLYEEALIESKERAEELADLRSLFLATLSHDVRSPLSAILTTAAVLRRLVDDDAVEQVERIERSCRQLRRILDSILRMAKLESRETTPEVESFDLVESIAEVVDMYEPLANNKELDLTFEAPDSPVEVELDPRFLIQILNNLVDNAITYTEEGEIRIGLTALDEKVRIRVDDTGIGISDEQRELIFERFETGSGGEPTQHDSTGLGLAIARLLVESMEGTISVESSPGEGSTFTIEFPRRLSKE